MAEPTPRRSRRAPEAEPEEARWLRREQTARNMAGLQYEQEGKLAEAVALYERNVAEGFAGDWPYGRLVAIYERLQQPAEAERVLLRAIEVFEQGAGRPASEQRALIRTFRKRLGLVRKKQSRG